MGNATYVGTVVSGKTKEDAIASYVTTSSKQEDNNKVLFKTTDTSNRLFLTSIERVVRPYSPVNGNRTRAVSLNHASIASSLHLESTSSLADATYSLYSATCDSCGYTQVSNSSELVHYCIHCGDGLDTSDEGSEHLNIQIENDDDEDYADLEAAEEDFGDDDDNDYEELDDEYDEEVEASGEYLDDDEYEEYEELDASDEEDETEYEELDAADEDGYSNLDEDYPELDAEDINYPMLPSDDEDESDAADEYTSLDDGSGEEEDYQSFGDIDESYSSCKSPKKKFYRVANIQASDTVEVDLIEDNLDETNTIANSSVKLVYVPSEAVDNHRWYAIVNDAPIAVATVASVGNEKSEIFATESFRKATEALMSQIGIVSALQDMGFTALKIQLPINHIVDSHVAKATAKTQATNSKELALMRKDLKAALATASVGINKGFFTRNHNPIKAELFDILSSAGVRNAEVLIDDAFQAKSDDYHHALLEQAFDLLKKPVDARNEISAAVMSANYQRSSVEDHSLSSSVSKQLSSFGTSNSMQNLPNEINPSFNERASKVIQGLLR